MLNEKKLTKAELNKREELIMKMKKNKRALVQKYGSDAEQVMYGRATNIAKKQAESMENDKLKEMVKTALQNPKAADLNKDGKLSDYEKKRGAAIEKSMKEEFDLDIDQEGGEQADTDSSEAGILDAEAGLGLEEMDINDPIAVRLRAEKDKLAKMRAANAGDDGNDEFFRTARKLRALKAKRAEIMSDMEQEAEMEGGPIADRYGDMLNKIDKAIAKLGGHGEWGPEKDTDISRDEIERRAAMINPVDTEIAKEKAMFGLEEGASSEEKQIAMRAIKSIAKYRGVSNDEARTDLIRAAKEIGDLKEDLDLGHQDDEPHMLKADLYRIGKYAMELYQMVDQFEGQGEVDFPHWWQSKVIKAKDALVGAKHYLDFEIKEPEIDAMVGVAGEEEVIDINEGVWSLGTAEQIKNAIKSLEMLRGMDAASIVDSLEDDHKFYYNVIGDDIFHDALDSASRRAAMSQVDGADMSLLNAIDRAEELLAVVQKREGLKEEAVNTRHIEDHEYMAAKIQKAMNDLDKKSEDYESKLYRLQQARKANNKSDFKTAMKIMKPFLAPVEETQYASLAEKLAKQLKSK